MPLEVFGFNPSTTVAIAKTAVAAGTTETWVVGSNTGWPTADPTALPNTQFHIADPQATSESVLVTDNRTTSWSVTRGVESTTPVAHSAGFTIQQVVGPTFLSGSDVRGGVYNAKYHFGCKGDGKQVTDGAMTNGSATFTSATAAFTAADVGKHILVAQATSTSMRLAGRIASVTNATTAVLSVSAALSGSGMTMVLDGVRTVTDAVTTSGSATVTSATIAFTANDVGKAVYVENANTVGLNTTISGYTNATTVTLAASATRTCSGSLTTYGTDDTTAIINAFTWAATPSATSLYFPASMYLAKPSHLGVNAMNIPANVRIFGDGWDTIIRSLGAEDPANRSWELWGINTGSGGSSDPSTNVSSVIIENMQFQGTQVEEGFLENGSNLLSLNAASGVTVRSCKFYNSRSDGVYLGSGTAGGIERHNENIRIEDCRFDGVANQCRNAISIIDGTDVSIDKNFFTGWANELMPGAIDSEPNDYTFIRLRGIRITNNTFTMIGGNQAVASIYLNTPADWYITAHKGWIFENNYIYNCLSSTIGILLSDPNYPSDVTPRLDAIVSNNVFRGNQADYTGLSYVADLEGIRGVKFYNNFFDITQNPILLGSNYKCMDIEIVGNTFKDVSSQAGIAIQIMRCERLKIDGNIFDHISPAGSGGYITRFTNAFASLITPSGVVATPSNTGGTLTAAHGAYGYRVAAYLDDGSTTVASTEVTATIASGTTGSIALSWPPVYGAKGYNVYGRTVAGELLMTPAGISQITAPGNVTFTDTGSVTPSGALPTASSSNGHSANVSFTGNIIRQGATNSVGLISGLVAGHATQANTLAYYNNILPNNQTLPISPFVSSQNQYTISASAQNVDASLVPDDGTVFMSTSGTSAGALTIINPTIGQVITFIFRIVAASGLYNTAANMKFAGGASAAKSTTAGYSDIYTFCYDGTNWNELSRAIGVR